MKRVLSKVKRKSFFQLLEVMIALFILMICAVPIMQTYVQMHIQEKDMEQLVKRNQLVHEIHAKLIEKLYTETQTIANFENERTEEIKDEELEKKLKDLGYKGHYKMYLEGKGRTNGDKRYYLLCTVIALEDLKSGEGQKGKKVTEFKYYLHMQGPKPPTSKEEDDDD